MAKANPMARSSTTALLGLLLSGIAAPTFGGASAGSASGDQGGARPGRCGVRAPTSCTCNNLSPSPWRQLVPGPAAMTGRNGCCLSGSNQPQPSWQRISRGGGPGWARGWTDTEEEEEEDDEDEEGGESTYDSEEEEEEEEEEGESEGEEEEDDGDDDEDEDDEGGGQERHREEAKEAKGTKSRHKVDRSDKDKEKGKKKKTEGKGNNKGKNKGKAADLYGKTMKRRLLVEKAAVVMKHTALASLAGVVAWKVFWWLLARHPNVLLPMMVFILSKAMKITSAFSQGSGAPGGEGGSSATPGSTRSFLERILGSLGKQSMLQTGAIPLPEARLHFTYLNNVYGRDVVNLAKMLQDLERARIAAAAAAAAAQGSSNTTSSSSGSDTDSGGGGAGAGRSGNGSAEDSTLVPERNVSSDSGETPAGGILGPLAVSSRASSSSSSSSPSASTNASTGAGKGGGAARLVSVAAAVCRKSVGRVQGMLGRGAADTAGDAEESEGACGTDESEGADGEKAESAEALGGEMDPGEADLPTSSTNANAGTNNSSPVDISEGSVEGPSPSPSQTTTTSTPSEATPAPGNGSTTASVQGQGQGGRGGRVFVVKFKEPDPRRKSADSLSPNMRLLVDAVGFLGLHANKTTDEVVLCLETPGGGVQDYGLMSAHLATLRSKGIRLTVCVDKYAASGGYMMACVADHICVAPFALLGSIGVLAEFTNIHRKLRSWGVDHHQLTAGIDKGGPSLRAKVSTSDLIKLQVQLDDIHQAFKDHIQQFRPGLDVEKVATGQTWLGRAALDIGLVDQVCTTSEYLWQRAKEADIIQITAAKPQEPWRLGKLAPFLPGVSSRVAATTTAIQNLAHLAGAQALARSPLGSGILQLGPLDGVAPAESGPALVASEAESGVEFAESDEILPAVHAIDRSIAEVCKLQM